jgi:hypothetical protein
MSENCENTGNNSGNLSQGPGVPDPNKETVVKPENNIPPRENAKQDELFTQPSDRPGKRIRTLGSFSKSHNKDEQGVQIPFDQSGKGAPELVEPDRRDGKDEVEPELRDRSIHKEQEDIQQPSDSEEKISVEVQGPYDRNKKELNEVDIDADASKKTVDTVSIPENESKDTQDIDINPTGEVKTLDEVVVSSQRVIKDASLDVDRDKERKDDVEVDADKTHSTKDEVETGREAPDKSPKVEEEFDDTSAEVKSEVDATPDEDHEKKTEEEIPSVESEEKDEVEVEDRARINEKGEVEIDDADQTEKGEQEVDETERINEKGEVEVIDENPPREDKPYPTEVNVEAGSNVDVSSPTVDASVESQKTNLNYEINTPDSGQILENDYDTSQSLRNKDKADEEEGNQNYDEIDSARNIKLSGSENIDAETGVDIQQTIPEDAAEAVSQIDSDFASQESENYTFDNYSSPRNVDVDFEHQEFDNTNPRKQPVESESRINAPDSETEQSQINANFYEDDQDDRLKNTRNEDERIPVKDGESEQKSRIDQLVQPQNQSSSNFDYQNDTERPYVKKSSDGELDHTIISEDNVLDDAQAKEVAFNNEYGDQISTKGQDTTQEINTNVSYDIDSLERGVDDTTNEEVFTSRSEDKSTPIKKEESSSIYASDSQLQDELTKDSESYSFQENENFNYSNLTTHSEGKPSAVEGVNSAKDGRGIAQPEEAFSIAKSSASVVDISDAQVRSALAATFGEDVVSKWEKQGTYVQNAYNKLSDTDYFQGQTQKQETTNFSYHLQLEDGSELTTFNKKEGAVAIKNSAFPSSAAGETTDEGGAFAEFTTPFTSDFGADGYVMPNNNVVIDGVNEGEGLPDSRDIGFGRAANGFIVGGAKNLIGTATGTEQTMNTVLSGISSIAEITQDFGEFGDGTTINNEIVNGTRRLLSTEAAQIANNIRVNAEISGDEALSDIAQSLGVVNDSAQTIGSLMNHPVAWMTNKFRELTPEDIPNAIQKQVNLATQGTKGNLRGDGIFDFGGEEVSISSSHAQTYSSFAQFRDSVLGIETGTIRVGTEGEEAPFSTSNSLSRGTSALLQFDLFEAPIKVNKYTDNVNIVSSFIPPAEYQSYLSPTAPDFVQSSKTWDINSDRSEFRKSAYNQKPITNSDLEANWVRGNNSPVGDETRSDIRPQLPPEGEINGMPIPAPTNINVDEDSVFSYFGVDAETGVVGDYVFNIDADFIDEKTPEISSIISNKYETYNEVLKNNLLDDGKIQYNEETDAHYIEATSSARLSGRGEGKDLFYQNLIDNDSADAYQHFAWTQRDLGLDDRHNIFNGFNAVANNTIQPSDVKQEERRALSHIRRNEDVNVYYDNLMLRSTNITSDNYNEQYLENGNLIDPHLSQIVVNYNGGEESSIYVSQGKDYFADYLGEQGADVQSWSGNTLEQLYHNVFERFGDADQPKNATSVVISRYKTKVPRDEGYEAYGNVATSRGDVIMTSAVFDEYRYTKNQGQGVEIKKSTKSLKDGSDIDVSYSIDVENNFRVLPSISPISIDDVKQDFTNSTEGSEAHGSAGANATDEELFAQASGTSVTFTRPKSRYFGNYEAPMSDDIVYGDPNPIAIVENPGSFVETEDFGLVRSTGEGDFSNRLEGYSTNGSRSIKREIAPKMITDKEIIKDKNGVKTRILEDTMIVFNNPNGTSPEDAELRQVAYGKRDSAADFNESTSISDGLGEHLNPALFYRGGVDSAELLSPEKKDAFYNKMKVKRYKFVRGADDGLKLNNPGTEYGVGFITAHLDPSGSLQGDNILYNIPMQFNPELTGESRSANWSQHTAIGRTNEFFIWANTASRTIQFKTSYAIISPGERSDSWFKDQDSYLEDGKSIYSDDWGKYWSEENIEKTLRQYRALLLPKNYSSQNGTSPTRTDGNRLAPPVIAIFFGEHIQSVFNNSDGTKSRWIATDLNIDPRLEAGYTESRNPRAYDITMTLKEIAPNWRSFQTHQQLGV